MSAICFEIQSSCLQSPILLVRYDSAPRSNFWLNISKHKLEVLASRDILKRRLCFRNTSIVTRCKNSYGYSEYSHLSDASTGTLKILCWRRVHGQCRDF